MPDTLPPATPATVDAPPNRSDWRTYAISAGVLAVAAASVVVAIIASTPTTAPVSTLTPSETMFLGLMHADPDADNSSLLYLGHGACEDMASVNGYGGVRLAVGKLMSYQEPPAYAQQMVAAARASELCAEGR